MTEFGLFLPNSNNGYIVSNAAPQYLPTYAINREITVEAERLGFDYALSMVKYRGFGGSTRFWDYYTESFTLTAALAEATERIRLFATVGILGVHPHVAARMMATLDDISGGRVGLNIVTGGWKPEYTQFGGWPGDEYYTSRYEHATHYVKMLDELWSSGRCTYESPLWTLEDCQAFPTPAHRIPLVNAGQSPDGKRFCAEFCDYSFVFAPPDRLKAHVADVNAEAAALGRTVDTMALFHVITGSTTEQARQRVAALVENADTAAIERMIEIQEANESEGSAKFFREGLTYPPEVGNVAFMGFPVLAGTCEHVAAELDQIIADTGVGGILLMFEDYVAGMRQFTDEIRPRLTTT
jgi:pyrimidine oxygenase